MCIRDRSKAKCKPGHNPNKAKPPKPNKARKKVAEEKAAAAKQGAEEKAAKKAAEKQAAAQTAETAAKKPSKKARGEVAAIKKAPKAAIAKKTAAKEATVPGPKRKVAMPMSGDNMSKAKPKRKRKREQNLTESVGGVTEQEQEVHWVWESQRILEGNGKWKGGSDDLCTMCCNGGNLACCDSCPRVYHLSCLKVGGEHIPSEDGESWHCPTCMSQHGACCMRCGHPGGSETRLLPCTSCPRAFHHSCLTIKSDPAPRMQMLPNGSWQCTRCAEPVRKKKADATKIYAQIQDLCCKLEPSDPMSLIGDRIKELCHLQKTVFRQQPLTGTQQSAADLTELAQRVSHLVAESTDFSTAPTRQRPVEMTAWQWGEFLGSRLPLSPKDATMQFHQHGLCCPAVGLSEAQVAESYQAVAEHFNSVMYTLRQLGRDQELEEGGFKTFKMRDHGRYDMVVPAFNKTGFSWFNAKAPWLPFVRAILGQDMKQVQTACIVSLPDSKTQKWHSDGDHCHDSVQLPVHCLNVFIPLVPLTSSNGPTEFIPGSHLDWSNASASPPLALVGGAGQAIFFDHRIKHRGLGNRSLEMRPLVYITYAKSWYEDLNNSELAGYQNLPNLIKMNEKKKR
eukprot:TRINITY_DN39508_c0_g1_i1.p1 TRINITY_DN39508_c0_g1~~TRINITY_DN39508_c0_g1_i1.p1  ORF type:complete len:656 (+),score=131.13 TRINITY_DN39508_c0_g1_i1:106-1968(+)